MKTGAVKESFPKEAILLVSVEGLQFSLRHSFHWTSSMVLLDYRKHWGKYLGLCQVGSFLGAGSELL